MGTCCGTTKPHRVNDTPPQPANSHPAPAPPAPTPPVPFPSLALPPSEPTNNPVPCANLEQGPKAEPTPVSRPFRSSGLEEEKMNRTIEDAFRAVNKRLPSSFSGTVAPPNPSPPQASAAVVKAPLGPRESIYLADEAAVPLVQSLHADQAANQNCMQPAAHAKSKSPLCLSVCTQLPNAHRRVQFQKHRNVSTSDTNFNKLLYAPETAEGSAALLDRKELVSVLTSEAGLKSYIRQRSSISHVSAVQLSNVGEDKGSSPPEIEEPIFGGFFAVPQFDLRRLEPAEKVPLSANPA